MTDSSDTAQTVEMLSLLVATSIVASALQDLQIDAIEKYNTGSSEDFTKIPMEDLEILVQTIVESKEEALPWIDKMAQRIASMRQTISEGDEPKILEEMSKIRVQKRFVE